MMSAIARLESGFEARFGYPIDAGSNYVAEAGEMARSESEVLLPQALEAFYANIGEVSLPDVHIGYFVHPAIAIAESEARALPLRIQAGEIQAEIATFGSDGGGGLFAINRDSGIVYYLPGGNIEANVYKGGLDAPRVVASGLGGFLDALLFRVETFANTGTCPDF